MNYAEYAYKLIRFQKLTVCLRINCCFNCKPRSCWLLCLHNKSTNFRWTGTHHFKRRTNNKSWYFVVLFLSYASQPWLSLSLSTGRDVLRFRSIFDAIVAGSLRLIIIRKFIWQTQFQLNRAPKSFLVVIEATKPLEFQMICHRIGRCHFIFLRIHFGNSNESHPTMCDDEENNICVRHQ